MLPLSAPATALVLAACGNDGSRTNGYTANERLAVVARTTPAAWYFEGNRAKGIDHDLLTRFAGSLNLKLEISHAANTSAALNTLCNTQAQMAVGLLTLPLSLQSEFRAGPRYGTFKQQLLYRFDHPRPSSITDLVMETVEVNAEPVHLETLLSIKHRNGDLTNWTLHHNLTAHDLLEMMDLGFAEYMIADSHAVTMTRRFYPRIQEAFHVSGELPLYWVFGECTDPRIIAAAGTFFAAAAADGTLAQIFDRYHGHATQLDYPEKLAFIKNVDRRLEQYKKLFIEAARGAGIDWKLLAAVSYQESHWNPQARSPSGVEGLMMLTRENAKRLKIEDRKDPSQSIDAGTRFLLALKQRLPPNTDEPDRTWLALAAYNAGFRCVENAMAMARAKKLNPALWVNVRDFLHEPPDADRKPKSACSMNDPLTYVYNIRAYRDLLAWLEGDLSFEAGDEPRQKRLPTATPAPI